MTDRVILHCDCNAFFASVETLLNPALADVPMAVTGDPDSRHGIILAKNERAKAFGVQTAETIWSAKQKCPALVCVRSHHHEYERISRLVNNIYLDYTDLVDPFGIDESFLD
ncbi:MAG: DNA polymerase IV, partial [Clostridia bacterium]|nr:DNA polymerase IV [Clostridia bacterium]